MTGSQAINQGVVDVISGSNTLDTFSSWAFTGIALVLLLGLIKLIIWSWKGEAKEPKGVWALVIGAALAIVAAHSDRITKLLISPKDGLDVELVHVKQVVGDAQVVLDGLRRLSATTGLAVVELGTTQGSFLDGTAKMRDEMSANVIAQLSSIDVAKEDIDKVVSASKALDSTDYYRGIEGRASYDIPDMNTKSSFFHSFYELPSPPGIDRIENMITNFNIKDRFLSGIIDDYAYYLKTGQQQRPEIWADRDNWATNKYPR